VFEVVAPHGLEVGGVMVGGVEDEGDTTVPQVMGPAIAVSVEDGCADVESSGVCVCSGLPVPGVV
jgi:hypothetical protein